jgi:hypothetical protein
VTNTQYLIEAVIGATSFQVTQTRVSDSAVIATYTHTSASYGTYTDGYVGIRCEANRDFDITNFTVAEA